MDHQSSRVDILDGKSLGIIRWWIFFPLASVSCLSLLAHTDFPAPVVFPPPQNCKIAPARVLPPLACNEILSSITPTTGDTPVSPISAPLLPQLLPGIVKAPGDVRDDVGVDVDDACGGGRTRVPGHVPELGPGR